MGNCKSKTIVLIIAILCIVVLGISLAFSINDTEAYAMQVEMLDNGIKLFKDILSSLRVENIEYLYNFDDSIDYIFIDFVGSNGYAILAEETLEILEYSLSGDLPYTRTNERKYYGGPNAYFIKNNNVFKNIITMETFEISDGKAFNLAENNRKSFSIKRKSFEENTALLNNKLNMAQAIMQHFNLNYQNDSNTVIPSTYPAIDRNNLISPTDGAQYIANSDYFLTEGASPKHGNNTIGSCTTVAIQLMLSYNNYYNDRRIISNDYLFGNEIENQERNPNYCINPESKTSYTLGSNQSFHDMLLNSYNIIGNFESSSEGLISYLNDRNIDADVNYTYTNIQNGYLDKNIVLTELIEDRPIVLETTSGLNGTYESDRPFNHAIIAYGYQSFAAYANNGDATIYDGYIAHFGWDHDGLGNKINVWTNEAWFNNAISLEINHTHEYSENTLICECGHRKSTYQTREVFSDFGYEGSTYSWKGSGEMSYDLNNQINPDEMLIVKDQSTLYFEVKTISSENAWLVTNGEIRFELEQSDGQIIQTNICTVTVDLLNNVTFTGNTFSIDTSQLGTGTYFLKMYCTFNRGEWSSETTHSYAFGVNRPITVMDEFGYLSSWYKWKGNVKLSSDHLYLFNNSNSLTLMGDVDLTFTIGTSFAFNAVKEMTGTVTIELQDSSGNIIPINGNNKHTSNIRVGLASNVSISNSSFTINISDFADDTYTLRLDCRMTRGGTTYNNSDTYSFSVRNEMCIAQGALITLADGTQKAVVDLTGDEQLLVWNMMTGQFDTAPILFIDSDEQRFYQVVNLYFSDGTSVKVIGEHAFWNKDLNEYVFLRKDADQYIGDSFIKQTINDNGEMVSSEVLLIDVVVTMEHTTAWSPVTYGHLCYYVNGMLSMPGATEGLINIFEVDPDAMRYDEEAMNQDIATYGLFTYEEFNALIPVPEEIFEAFNGQYLKVSIGKGYTSIEELAQLIERYSQFF